MLSVGLYVHPWHHVILSIPPYTWRWHQVHWLNVDRDIVLFVDLCWYPLHHAQACMGGYPWRWNYLHRLHVNIDRLLLGDLCVQLLHYFGSSIPCYSWHWHYLYRLQVDTDAELSVDFICSFCTMIGHQCQGKHGVGITYIDRSLIEMYWSYWIFAYIFCSVLNNV